MSNTPSSTDGNSLQKNYKELEDPLQKYIFYIALPVLVEI
jgi:hypothetical protein